MAQCYFSTSHVVIDLSELKKNDLIDHPKGGKSFGKIPAFPQYNIREGEIYLRKGVHPENGRGGFGLAHIWGLHHFELKKLGYGIEECVPDYVALILESNAEIYCDLTEPVSGRRLTILRSHTGIVVLEPRNDRQGFGYYVVTAYPKRATRGTRIGVLK